MDVSSLYGSQSQIRQYVELQMMTEREPVKRLQEKKTKLSEEKSVLTNLHSKLSALKTETERMTDIITDYFQAKKVNSSDSEFLSATAGSQTPVGSHSVSVTRLASSDTRVSQQYTSDNSDFTAIVTDQTFEIEVGHPTDEDPNNRVQISVTVAASEFSGTNDEVLAAVSEAIQSAMQQAVTDEIIDSDEVVHSSVVNEETGTSRLVFRSEKSGFTHRMDFGASTLLDSLEVNAAVQSSGTAGGYMHNVGTSASDSELNSQFTLDGLTFYRDSNNVTDAIEGLTLELRDVFAVPETLSITADVDTIKEEVNNFIESYNEAVTFLRENAQINPDSLERGALADNVIYRGLLTELRSMLIDEIEGTASQSYTRLFHLGIEADQKGKLSIKDIDKFTRAVESNTLNVSDIFHSETGIGAKVKDIIDNFVSASGTISSNKKSIDSEVRSLNDRIKYMEQAMERREKQLYDEFAKLQETMVQVSNQQSFFNLFNSGGQGFY